MLASNGALPDRGNWAFEVKWDGARVQVSSDGRTVSMRSRRGRACAEEFPEIRRLLDCLQDRRVVLDGELVCLGADGKPDFASLRTRLGVRDSRSAAAAQQRRPATLMFFDVLHLDG